VPDIWLSVRGNNGLVLLWLSTSIENSCERKLTHWRVR